MSSITQSTIESNINEGDRVRVHIPYPDDGSEDGPYKRDIRGRLLPLEDHLRYNRRRGTVLHRRDDITYMVEFDDPEQTLTQNPPNIGFLPDDLRVLDESDTARMSVILDPARTAGGNGEEIIYRVQEALVIHSEKAEGSATRTKAIADELATRLVGKPYAEVRGNPREQHPTDEIVRAANDILADKAAKLVHNHDELPISEELAELTARELRSRFKEDEN